MIKLNLLSFFAKEAKNLRTVYKRLLSNKRGIANDTAPSNAPSTVRKKGKNHWLIDTAETKNKGILYDAKNDGFKVYASDKTHSGAYLYKGQRKRRKNSEISYREIFELHNQKNYSGIFGDELPAQSKFPDRFERELLRQIKPQLEKVLEKRVKIRLKI